jgi:AcrR family transcriptional regulator
VTGLSYGGDIIPTQTFFNLDEDKQNRIVECAFDEFSQRGFEHAKLSNIIKEAQIPRGSLYQYFKDKTDLYLYLMEIAKNRKLVYIQEFFSNPMDLPFIELFKSMYTAGIKFAVDNPKMVKMMSHLLNNKGPIYDLVFENNLDIALELYSSLIDRDKELGRIRKDIDTNAFAKLVIDMTINVSVKILTSKECTKGLHRL